MGKQHSVDLSFCLREEEGEGGEFWLWSMAMAMMVMVVVVVVMEEEWILIYEEGYEITDEDAEGAESLRGTSRTWERSGFC